MSAVTSITLSLPRELERFVREQIASGRYQTADEVVLHGLRLFQEQERDHGLALQEVREKIQRGIEQAERGQLVDPSRHVEAVMSRRLHP